MGDGPPTAEKLIFRFSPFSAEKLLENAEDTVEEDEAAGRPPRLGVSVFADVRSPTETADDVLRRVLVKAPVDGKSVSVMTAEELAQAGYPIELDEPPPKHHLVLLGHGGGAADVATLAELVARRRRKNPHFQLPKVLEEEVS